MGASYIVSIDLELDRAAEQKMAAIGKSLHPLDQALVSASRGMNSLAGMAGSKLMGAMDSVARSALQMGKYFGMAAGAAGIGAIYKGVAGLNAELEGTVISLGAVFNANGLASSMPDGLKMAGNMFAKMRQDAKLLPGELNDLLTIYRTGIIPAVHSGIGADQFRVMSSKAMAAAAVSALPMDQAAREFAMLLEGRSGAHNVFGMRLLGLSGDKAEKFNKMDAGDRAKLLGKELDKYGESITTFGRSWEGVTSTLKDSVKLWLTDATMPLFERMKGSIGDLNQWLDANEGKLQNLAVDVGKKLVDAFEWAKKKIQEWYPVVKDFAVNAYQRLSEIWKEIAPHAERFGNALQSFMKDPKAIDKLITLGKVYLAMKGGQAGLGLMGGVSDKVVSMAGGLMGTGAGGAAAGAATGAASSVFGGLGGAAAGIGGLGAATLGAAGAAVVSGYALFYQELMLVSEAFQHFRRDAELNEKAQRDWAQRVVADYKSVEDATIGVNEQMAALRAQGEDTKASFLELALAARAASADLSNIASHVGAQQDAWVGRDDKAWSMMLGQKALANLDKHAAKEKKKKVGHGGGGGGTKIQKVEIVVTSNQHPSRIAKEVLAEVGKLSRSRRSSPHLRNHSVASPI